jgi:hypothetical protein
MDSSEIRLTAVWIGGAVRSTDAVSQLWRPRTIAGATMDHCARSAAMWFINGHLGVGSGER